MTDDPSNQEVAAGHSGRRAYWKLVLGVLLALAVVHVAIGRQLLALSKGEAQRA